MNFHVSGWNIMIAVVFLCLPRQLLHKNLSCKLYGLLKPADNTTAKLSMTIFSVVINKLCKFGLQELLKSYIQVSFQLYASTKYFKFYIWYWFHIFIIANGNCCCSTSLLLWLVFCFSLSRDYVLFPLLLISVHYCPLLAWYLYYSVLLDCVPTVFGAYLVLLYCFTTYSWNVSIAAR